MMTLFSSPAYATMLSNGDALPLEWKAKAFVVHLPVPFCLISYLCLTENFADISIAYRIIKCESLKLFIVRERANGNSS